MTKEEETWVRRAIAQAQATDKALVDSINGAVETATKQFTDGGVSPALARELAERAVERVLYDVQTSLGGW